MYKIFPDNIITKGYTRDLLIDFGRDQMTVLPKKVTAFIESLKNESLKDQDIVLLDELLKKEIIFRIDSDEELLFPDLNLEWDLPATISNAVIEINKKNVSAIGKILSDLEQLNCFYYTFIISENICDKDVEILETALLGYSIISFDLVINYFKSEKLNEFINKLLMSPRLQNKIKVFNCNDSIFLNEFKDVLIVRNMPFGNKCCGLIKEENFNINLSLFTESQQNNTCLNRKINIDSSGNIKNCPCMKENFGNIKDTKLAEAVNKPGFKKLWGIKKADIKVCKDCEYRHVCTDCRAFTEDPSDLYSKPLKCGYDPYTGSWDDWSTNPLKAKAIEYYGLR
ncbi:MAG: grasp-with-spasm system SPASM domain peptide maturase [Bacteroidia bacterium]|nr:grasp-with-spasm system SPASM domain peptide maturase [Bacteroidia bacterium]